MSLDAKKEEKCIDELDKLWDSPETLDLNVECYDLESSIYFCGTCVNTRILNGDSVWDGNGNEKPVYPADESGSNSKNKNKNKSKNKGGLEKYIEEYRPAFAHRKNHKKDKITGKYEMIGENGVYRLDINSNGRDMYFFMIQHRSHGISIWVDSDKNEEFCKHDDVAISFAQRNFGLGGEDFLYDLIPKKGKFKLKRKASVFKDQSFLGMDGVVKNYTPHNAYWQFGKEKFVYAAYRGLDSARNLDRDDWLKMRKGQFVAGIDDGFGNSEANLVGDTDLIVAYVLKDYKGLKTFKNKNLRGKGKVLSYHIPWLDEYIVPPTFEAVAAELDIAYHFGMKDNSGYYDDSSLTCRPSDVNHWLPNFTG